MSSDSWEEPIPSNQEFLDLERQADLDGFMETPSDSQKLEIDFLSREVAGLGFSQITLIGRGGTSHVFRATDGFGKTVAVKLVSHPALRTNLRFSREVSALKKVQHSNIPKILDHGTTESRLHYIVLQLIQGQPIDTYCRENRLSVDERVKLLIKMCPAVEFAHRHKILHRDLKPSNVLVTTNREVFVTDFGLARPLDLSPCSDRTGTSEIVGTLGYLAPESLFSIEDQISEATDVFGIGGILFNLLTGRPPLNFEDFVDAVQNYFSRLPSTVDTDPPCSPKLAAICIKCLAPHPRHRYRAVSKLRAELESLLSGRSVRAKNVAWLRKVDLIGRQNPRLFRGVCLALLMSLLCVTAVFGMWRRAIHSERATLESNERLSEIVRGSNAPGELELRLKLLTEIAKNYEQIEHRIKSNSRLMLNAARTDFQIGMAYQQLGQHDRATENWTKAKLRFEDLLNFRPDHEDARFGYFHSMYSLREYAAAASVIHSLNLDVENIEYLAAECNTYLNLGAECIANSRFEASRPYLETGLDISQRLSEFPDPSGRFRRNEAKAKTLLARSEIANGKLEKANNLVTESIGLYRQLNPLGYPTASEAAEYLVQLRFAMVLSAFKNDTSTSRKIYVQSKSFFDSSQQRFPQYPQLYNAWCSILREYAAICAVHRLETTSEEACLEWEKALDAWKSNATISTDYWASSLVCHSSPWRTNHSAPTVQAALRSIEGDGRYPLEVNLGYLYCNDIQKALSAIETTLKQRPQDPELSYIFDAILELQPIDSDHNFIELPLNSRCEFLARTLSFERSFHDHCLQRISAKLRSR